MSDIKQNVLMFRFKTILRSTKLSRRCLLLHTSQISGPTISMTPLSWLNAHLFFSPMLALAAVQEIVDDAHVFIRVEIVPICFCHFWVNYQNGL